VVGSSAKRTSGLRIAFAMSWIAAALAALASTVGLLVPQVYRFETAWVIPQNRGQDLVTLIVVLVLAPTLLLAQRGASRATLVWLGLLGYLAYTYTAAALVYRFNELFFVYLILFSCIGTALIAGLSGVSPESVRDDFDERAPRRSVAIFMIVMALVLCILWLSQIVPFFTRGELPPMIALANVPTVFVYVFDLGIVVPLALMSARWLWKRNAWGYVLAGFILVKASTMGLALVSMTVFSALANLRYERTLALAWIVLAGAGLVMSSWYFRHCSNEY
jgi:hypothetical protein